jgi:hypothetical protein
LVVRKTFVSLPHIRKTNNLKIYKMNTYNTYYEEEQTNFVRQIKSIL